MKNLTEAELGYIAGIIDGEGTISLGKKKNQNPPSYSVFVQITNTDKILIDWLKNKIGFGRIVFTDKSLRKHKNCYDLEFNTQESKQVLEAILPYLIIKKPRAELVLEFIDKSICNHKGVPKSDDLILEHEFIYRELAILNKRGL